ncbi:hypothetical protein DXG01_009328 [Tephrocybe rancida]|nr:hypothetical protein DXG01_009328 [Tephrocybe rancida]
MTHPHHHYHHHHNAPIPFRTDRVRLLVFLKRKQGITHEEFSHYWHGPHARAFMSLDIVKTNVITYEQLHANIHQTAPAVLGVAADWDGIILLDGESYDKLFAVFESEEYKTHVLPDNQIFVDITKSSFFLANLATLIENHSEIPGA